MIFHQASRYYIAKKCIKSVNGEIDTILEFGAGSHFNLRNVFPDSEITFLDLNMPEELLDGDRCVKGDITNLQYPDNMFDFLIGLDVLEHIPIEKRCDAIKNIVRVSKKGFFISFPMGDEKSDISDSILELYYRQLHICPPIWIREHVDCLLPKVETIIDLIRQEGVGIENIACIYGSDIELERMMLFIEAMASKSVLYTEYFRLINDFYINHVMPFDFSLDKGNQSKAYIMVCKNQGISNLAMHMEQNCRMEIKKFINQLENEEKWLWYTNFSDMLIEPAPIIDLNKNRINVVLITYNHEKYIAEALDSIVKQVTDFKFNIIVADDCSSDNTVEIIREFEKKTNVEFVYLDNSKNLGTRNNYKRAFEICDAEYIAIMEGDDYWTCNLRLQKMCTFLDTHKECAMVFNRYNVNSGEKSHVQPTVTDKWISGEYTLFTGYDLAYSNVIGNFSTSIYRRSAIRNLPADFYTIPGYDWITNICISRMGYIGCLADVMSTYRIHDKGLWSGKKTKEKNKEIIEGIDIYDKYTNYEFHESFQEHKSRLIAYKKTKIKNIILFVYDCVPPIFVYIIKAIIPPKLIKKLRK